MKLLVRLVVLSSVSVLLLFSYTNCSQTSENNLFNGKYLCPDGSTTCNAPAAKRMIMTIGNTPGPQMTCSQDQIQIGGYCNPGDTTKNLVQYWIERGGKKLNWGALGENPVNVGNEVVCENGRFSLTLRRPNDPNATACTPTSNCLFDYDLRYQIFSYKADGSTVGSDPGKFGFQIEWCGNADAEKSIAALPRAPQQKALASVSLAPPGKAVVGTCKGVGSESSQIACSKKNLVDGFGAPSANWRATPLTTPANFASLNTLARDVTAFSGSITSTCPTSTKTRKASTKIGSCQVSEHCSEFGVTSLKVPYCLRFMVECDFTCYEP